MYNLKPDEHKNSKLFFRSLYIPLATPSTLPFPAAVPLAGPHPLTTSLMVIRRKAIYRFRPTYILLVEIIQIIFLYHLGSSHAYKFDIAGYRRLKVIEVESPLVLRGALVSQIYFGIVLYMFRTGFLPIIRSLVLYTQQ